MKTTLKLAILTLVTLPIITPAPAEEPPAPAPAPAAVPAPAPPKEMEQLKHYEGSWICTGAVPKSPFGPERKTSTTLEVHSDLDGMWLSGQIEEAASKENPQAYRGVVHLTYDTANANFVTLFVDNTGGWVHQTSKGWEHERMVWLGEGVMAGSKVTARDTFTNQGAALKHIGELQVDGKWVLVQNENCNPKPAEKK